MNKWLLSETKNKGLFLKWHKYFRFIIKQLIDNVQALFKVLMKNWRCTTDQGTKSKALITSILEHLYSELFSGTYN